MPRLLSMGLILFLALVVGTEAARGEEASTIAVVNFINRNAPDDWDWLEKGFADLLITDLARSDRLTVVERERMIEGEWIDQRIPEQQEPETPVSQKKRRGGIFWFLLGLLTAVAMIVSAAFLLVPDAF